MRITRTSDEYKKQKAAEGPPKNICPECGKPNLGIVRTEHKGFLRVKVIQTFMHSCSCGCKWEYEEVE